MTSPAHNKPNKISSFSIILIVAAMAIVSIGLIPLLNVSYTPQSQKSHLTISYEWDNASARVMEQEVTTPLEGVLSMISGVEKVTSVSGRGNGRVDLTFKKGVNIEAARFEVATQLRFIYSKLPDGVSYPYISSTSSGTEATLAISYELNAPATHYQIENRAKAQFMSPISRIPGVDKVSFHGATPFEYFITFDPEISSMSGITAQDIMNAFNNHFQSSILGTRQIENDGVNEQISVLFSGPMEHDFDNIPIGSYDGKLFYLKDFAQVTYKEALPTSYYRINGLNTIQMNVYVEDGVNIINVVDLIRDEVNELRRSLPEGYSVMVSYDSSNFIRDELQKIIVRTLLSLAILLTFVLLASRSFRYLLIIFISLIANILIAVIFYKLFDVGIHMYSLVGVTTSLGIVIDASILMVDHYGYNRNTKIFPALLGALLTTIGALCVIYLLPEEQKLNLTDFTAIIIINLTVALVVTLLFVPALMDKLSLNKGVINHSRRSRRGVIIKGRYYSGYISWSRCHRWVLIVILILAFGIPVHLLPSKIEAGENEKLSVAASLYNKTIGGSWYQDHKSYFEKTLGGSLRLFTKNMSSFNFFNEPEQVRLYINTGLPEGCTVQQLNDVVMEMENFLSQFDQIEMFRTSITSYDRGSIIVTFSPEVEKTAFPYNLQQQAISQAIRFGGATWQIGGVDQNSSFNNNVGIGDQRSCNIKLIGYNYDMLYDYALIMLDSLSANQRVAAAEVREAEGWYPNKTEFYMRYDPVNMLLRDITPNDFYSYLSNMLYSARLRPVFTGEEVIDVQMVSSQLETFDVWHLNNDIAQIDSSSVKLAEFGSIKKALSGNRIHKQNQVYFINVSYNFTGSPQLSQKVMDRVIKHFNDDVLPVGFSAESFKYVWSAKDTIRWINMILLVIAIIYFICAILFESLLKPLVIILMIPISFIGLFLTFAIGGFTFDQGGYAAFITLSGITVNAGIYLINEYNLASRNRRGKFTRIYIKSYNRKIIPIILTIVSTVMGLIPFVINGGGEAFWFAFAVGTMGGMVFSIIALVFYLPIFLPYKKE